MVSFEQVSAAMFNTTSLADAALAYARAGIPVFPLAPGDKQPIVPNGFYSATTNQQVVARWWRGKPSANIGVPCGKPSGWWVIDIDPRHGGWEALERLHRDIDCASTAGPVAALLYTTRRQLTGGDGAHLIFRRRPDLDVEMSTMPNFAGYKGIDYKGDRSYVMVAPSIHPSGKPYQWLNDEPIEPFPDALVERWIAHRKRGFTSQARAQQARPPQPDPIRDYALRRNEPRYYLSYALSQAYEGQRNRFALYLACRLVEDVGLGWDQAVPWMLEYVACVSQSGHAYTEDEALSALDWAFKQAQQAA